MHNPTDTPDASRSDALDGARRGLGLAAAAEVSDGRLQLVLPPQPLQPTQSQKSSQAAAWAAFTFLLLRSATGVVGAAELEDQEFFDQHVAPILSSYCLECHRGPEARAGLDLSTRASTQRGGESGPAVTPPTREGSLLWRRIAAGEMPPKKPLPPRAAATLGEWLDRGARWGADPIDPFRFSTETRGGADWWSLRPLRATPPPSPPPGGSPRLRNAIDAFVFDQLRRRELDFSADAKPRELVRRVHLDLIGLPPAEEVVERFCADPSEQAYSRLVDQLLNSPAYGERWGRHWLDVARFGESDGFERNGPRKNLWPYRDWVIDALNADLPFDEFARRQIAGDALGGYDPESLAAVGFLVAGVHNTVVGGSERMRRAARQDELEEVIGAIGQTFLGMTVNCARCHDHKFDPIRQAEYFQLTASIAGVFHGEREAVDRDAERAAQEVESELRALDRRRAAVERPAREAILSRRQSRRDASDPRRDASGPAPLAAWDFTASLQDQIGSLHGKAVDGARQDAQGLHLDGQGFVETAPLAAPLREKTLAAWVQLADLQQRGGGVLSVQTLDGATFDAIVYGEQEPLRWMAGSNVFRRTQSFQGPAEAQAAEAPVHLAIVYSAEGDIAAYRNGQPYGRKYRSVGLQAFEAGQAQAAFGIRHKPAGGNRMLRATVLRAALYDKALTPDEVAEAADARNAVAESELRAELGAEAAALRAELLAEQAALRTRLEALRRRGRSKLYSVLPAAPAPTYFLERGDAMLRGAVVAPGGVQAISRDAAPFSLPADASDAERRIALAKWIANRDNPLFARVIVNRLWHYHFGVGIVDTPNDLGFNGGRPSHPELLDYLALQLLRADFRLKPLHRMIVHATAYRQSSRFNPRGFAVDAGNRLLWRKSPRRLEAEVLRDSLLAVSGALNRQAGGPGFEDVTSVFNSGTTYYEPFDREDPQLNRRTVYRFGPRGGRSALLDAFDCPDPSAAAPRRSVTTTPLQALSLLNSDFLLRMADHFANRARQAGGDRPADQAMQAFRLALGRPADAEEQAWGAELIEQHGLPALARALFNSNEFVISP